MSYGELMPSEKEINKNWYPKSNKFSEYYKD